MSCFSHSKCFIDLAYLILNLLIERILSQEKWGRFPIVQGGYYAHYFGGELANKF